jgi:hypothetical protein
LGVRPRSVFEPPGMIIGIDGELKVPSRLIMAGVVVAFDGGVFDGPVHSFDLAVRRGNSPPDCFLILLTPRVVRLGQSVFDSCSAQM